MSSTASSDSIALPSNDSPLWMTSFHGGHSGEFCDHAKGTLRETLEAAVQAGFRTYGVSEHAPHSEDRFLTAEELVKGWNADRLRQNFENYSKAVNALADEFSDRLTILRGYEAEIVPTATYQKQMTGYRRLIRDDGKPLFDYMVGSVHYVDELVLDYTPEAFKHAVEACGGFENLVIGYYNNVARLAVSLQPNVIGHLDLVKRYHVEAGFGDEPLQTPRIEAAAEGALEAIRSVGALLDLNTAGWRKGLGEPYPAPWLVTKAHAMGLHFSFGDDSHKPEQVGDGIVNARDYLLKLGVEEIGVLVKEKGATAVHVDRVRL